MKKVLTAEALALITRMRQRFESPIPIIQLEDMRNEFIGLLDTLSAQREEQDSGDQDIAGAILIHKLARIIGETIPNSQMKILLDNGRSDILLLQVNYIIEFEALTMQWICLVVDNKVFQPT